MLWLQRVLYTGHLMLCFSLHLDSIPIVFWLKPNESLFIASVRPIPFVVYVVSVDFFCHPQKKKKNWQQLCFIKTTNRAYLAIVQFAGDFFRSRAFGATVCQNQNLFDHLIVIYSIWVFNILPICSFIMCKISILPTASLIYHHFSCVCAHSAFDKW